MCVCVCVCVCVYKREKETILLLYSWGGTVGPLVDTPSERVGRALP